MKAPLFGPVSSIVTLPAKMAIAVMLTVSLPIMGWMGWEAWRNFEREVAQIEELALANKRYQCLAIVEDLLLNIRFRQAQVEHVLQQELRAQVENLHASLAHIDRITAIAGIPVGDKQIAAKAILSGMQMTVSAGYVFVASGDGSEEIYCDPRLPDSKKLVHLRDASGRPILKELIRLLRDSGPRIHRYARAGDGRDAHPPGAELSAATEAAEQEIVYLKWFEPYGWVIGAVARIGEEEKRVQQDITRLIEGFSWGKAATILVLDSDNRPVVQSLLFPDDGPAFFASSAEDGRNLADLIRQSCRESSLGAYYRYTQVDQQTGQRRDKLCYARGVWDWGWTLIAEVSLETITEEINTIRSRAQSHFRRSMLFIGGVLGLNALLLGWVGRSYASRLKGGFIHFQQFMMHSGGGDRRIRVSALPFSEMKLLGEWLNAMLEKLEQRETQLREKNIELRRLQQAIDQASVSVVITDTDGTIRYVNPKFSEVTGYSLQEAVGQNPRILKSGSQPPAFYENLWQTIKAGRVWTGEFHNRRRDGRCFWESAHIAPVTTPEGKLVSFVAVKEDITERKRFEEELRRTQAEAEDANVRLTETNRKLETALMRANEMTREAEAANQAKSQFLATMSHEIRTPMNGVIGMTELLLDTGLSSEQRRYAETVRSSAESLLAIINDILDFSKIESGRLELEAIDFDLRVLVDDVASMLAVRAHDRGLELICFVEPDVPSALRGDPGRLRQVLVNLGGNAVKFTPGGEVCIRVTQERETETEALLRFSVKDTGIGIAADKQEMIFESFSQADASITRRFGGTGLGLAISRRLVDRMGGRLQVNSAEGQGAEFWFKVPFARSTEAGDSKPKLSAHPGLHDARILVVDDNATNREVLQAQLRAWGVRAEAFGDGAAAFRALRAAAQAGAPFRAAILDMQMPGMDGETLGRMIRAEPGFNRLRLVVLTSMGRPGDAGRLGEAGFDAYLTKPVRPSDLRDTLLAALAEQPAAADRRPILTRHVVREMRRAGLRILVADDNRTNREVALGILRKLGLNALAVENGREALAALESEDWDLVLLDVQMPEMDGYETARRIREPGSAVRNRRIPILAMTANVLPGDRQRCLDAGMDDYVAKPISAKALAAAVERWLSKQDSRPEEQPAGTGEPPGAAAEGQSGFERAVLEQRLLGDADLIRSVVEGFLEDMPTQIETLERALADGDAGESTRLAHAIKGAAANVGGEALRQTAAGMEQMGRKGDLDAMRQCLPRLKRNLGALADAMRTSLADLLAESVRPNERTTSCAS